MTRQIVRDMKRRLASGMTPSADPDERQLARASALALLERSIGFGHARLAVIRLSIAAHAGAEIPPAHWAYCEQAARRSRDATLQALWLGAAEEVSRRAVTH
jgi:hypothetical protein